MIAFCCRCDVVYGCGHGMRCTGVGCGVFGVMWYEMWS